MRRNKDMQYYEINSHYYALIGAESEEEALNIYVEVVADDDDGTLKDDMQEVERDYALVRFARSRGEDNKLLPYTELLEEFEDKGVLLMDSSLS